IFAAQTLATMWHDARKQEKLIRRTLIDQSKRGEKRRRFYDAVRADPDQFMQIHGRRAVVHTEAAVARAAEDSAVLRPWQGDGKVLIDRFDARSHLDHILKPTHREVAKDSPEAKMEILCDFERYRILIINEYRKVGEKEYLKKIGEAEYWHKASHATQKTLKMQELEKKKKSAATKAAVGFSYEDSDVVRGRTDGDGESESESDDDEDDGMEDIDVELDMSCMDAESARKANLLGESFGVSRCSFVDLQMAETSWARNQAELKQIEREKLAISGKNGRRERRQLKYRRQLILGKGVVGNEDAHMSLLAMIGANDSKKEGDEDSSSSSESDCNDFGKTVFIRSLDASGKVEEDEEDQTTSKPLGPVLPNQEYRRVLSLTKKRSESPQPFAKNDKEKGWRSTRRDMSRSPRRRSRSRSRSRSRYTSTRGERGGRSRSRERRRSSRERRSPRGRSRSSRDRSVDRHRRRRRNGSSSSQGSTPKRRREGRGERKSAERRAVSSSDSDRSGGGGGEVVDEPMLSIHSSMSEDEREKREIENRKRRIRKTKAMIKQKHRAASPARSTDTEEEEKKRMVSKIRSRMQKNLSKTVDELRAEKEDKRKERERYYKDRETALEDERERMKRARDDERDRAKRVERERERDRRGGGRDGRYEERGRGERSYRRRSRSRS
ncbi:hypothetical protein PRIPAC_71061, partial [Pristionchus pacificus]